MRKTVLVPVALAVVLALAGGAWYQHYRRTPQYALTQLTRAVAQKDELAFEMYFDTKRVSQSIAEDLVSSAVAQSTRQARDESGFGAIGTMLGAQMLQGMKPALASMMESSIQSAVRGEAPAAGTSRGELLQSPPDLRRFRDAFKGIERIEQREDLALVRVRIQPEGDDSIRTFTVRMERAGGVWRVVGIEHLAEQLQQAQESGLEGAYAASMKSDLRNLVTAEEAYFADSVKYTTNLGSMYITTTGVTGPTITLTRDGWTAWVASTHTTTTCAIFVGAVPLAPAVREREPRCSQGARGTTQPIGDPDVASMKSDLRNLVTAEEAYFADSVKYTSNLGRSFYTTTGVTGPTIILTADGWKGWVGSRRTTMTCAIFVGSSPLPPAVREGAPACQEGPPMPVKTPGRK